MSVDASRLHAERDADLLLAECGLGEAAGAYGDFALLRELVVEGYLARQARTNETTPAAEKRPRATARPPRRSDP